MIFGSGIDVKLLVRKESLSQMLHMLIQQTLHATYNFPIWQDSLLVTVYNIVSVAVICGLQ
jgi:hypothetical protein